MLKLCASGTLPLPQVRLSWELEMRLWGRHFRQDAAPSGRALPTEAAAPGGGPAVPFRGTKFERQTEVGTLYPASERECGKNKGYFVFRHLGHDFCAPGSVFRAALVVQAQGTSERPTALECTTL